MSELDDHTALLVQQRDDMRARIAALHDGDRKTTLKAMLADIEERIRALDPVRMALMRGYPNRGPNRKKW